MNRKKYKDKLEFVDDFSLKIEEMGHPRIYGQILGWLIVCEPHHQSFSDLMTALNISKASVSNTTRILLEAKIIEKVRITGERQVYFKLKKNALLEFMGKQNAIFSEIKTILDDGRQFLLESGETDIQRIEKARQFYIFMAAEFPSLLEKFNSEFGA
ncbi:MAG: hypothetical protein PQJ46_10120 [Spirochaetales bacterium]|nr:hypothetical protein [Spirochaetales bacterium]